MYFYEVMRGYYYVIVCFVWQVFVPTVVLYGKLCITQKVGASNFRGSGVIVIFSCTAVILETFYPVYY